MKTYGNVILMTAICIVILWVFMALRPAQAGPECVGDVGRCHGYMPAGYIGAHPSNRGVHSCTWSSSSYCANWRANGGNSASQARSPKANHCDSTCQAKCQASWRALGFRSVNACVARWHRLNAEGTAATCETAIKANGMRPVRGC
jgi:hypothetical protein